MIFFIEKKFSIIFNGKDRGKGVWRGKGLKDLLWPLDFFSKRKNFTSLSHFFLSLSAISHTLSLSLSFLALDTPSQVRSCLRPRRERFNLWGFGPKSLFQLFNLIVLFIIFLEVTNVCILLLERGTRHPSKYFID